MSPRQGASPPPGTLECEHAPLATGWAMQALEPAEEHAFLAHLPGCDRCAGTVALTGEVIAALAVAGRQYDPPPALRARLMARVAGSPQRPRRHQPAEQPAERPGRRSAPGTPAGRRLAPAPTRHRGRVLAAAATLAAVLAIGVAAWHPSASPGPADPRAAQGITLLHQVDTPGTTARALLATPDGQPVAAVARHPDELELAAGPRLPISRPGQMYVLWGMTGTGPVPLGGFTLVGGSRDPVRVGAPPTATRRYPAYAMSIEPAGPLPPAPTRPVASGVTA